MRPVVNGLLKSPTDLDSIELCNVAAKLNTLTATTGGLWSGLDNAKPKLPIGPYGERNVSVNGVCELHVQTLELSFYDPTAL